ncbi:hypothetical protein X924_05575 [Petrotoga sp. 9PWA.NaAc.5.4]|nr:hypothetical protein X924_05575 [Petrotoga sp. 9PWA.NaAc.5.4]
MNKKVVTLISNLDEFKGILDLQNSLLNQLKQAFIELRENITKKAAVKEVNNKLLEIEVLANDFRKIENLRNEVVLNLCRDENIDNNIESLMEYFTKKDYKTALLLSQLVLNVKELMDEINLLNDIIVFQTNLNDFIYKILNPASLTHGKTYTNTGKDKDSNISTKSWRG